MEYLSCRGWTELQPVSSKHRKCVLSRSVILEFSGWYLDADRHHDYFESSKYQYVYCGESGINIIVPWCAGLAKSLCICAGMQCKIVWNWVILSTQISTNIMDIGFGIHFSVSWIFSLCKCIGGFLLSLMNLVKWTGESSH